MICSRSFSTPVYVCHVCFLEGMEVTFVVPLICEETNHFIHFIPSRVVPASSVARHQPCSCSRSASDQVHSNQRLLFGGRTSVSAALGGAEERLSLAMGLDPNLSFHSKRGLLLSASQASRCARAHTHACTTSTGKQQKKDDVELQQRFSVRRCLSVWGDWGLHRL